MLDKTIQEDIHAIIGDVDKTAFAEKRVLVTGGAGFLGSILCDVLLNLDSQVVCLDDFSTGRKQNIGHLSNQARFKLLKRDAATFRSAEKFDWIFHFAGHASPDEYQAHPIATLRTSSLGSEAMAELARKNDAVLVFASTSEVYGDAEVIPTPETYWGKVNPVGPRSCYDEGKRFAEALLLAYHSQYGLDVRLPRIFNSYGPRLREDGLYGRAMSRFIMQALAGEPITVYGDGKQTRSFSYVTDTLTGILRLATTEGGSGEVTNVGSNQEVSILTLAMKIRKLTKTRSPIVFKPLPKDDPKRRCPDTTKLERLTGWTPKVEFDDGLKRMIDWFSSKKTEV
jgi:UDP-glucuronate decarboxylase